MGPAYPHLLTPLWEVIVIVPAMIILVGGMNYTYNSTSVYNVYLIHYVIIQNYTIKIHLFISIVIQCITFLNMFGFLLYH